MNGYDEDDYIDLDQLSGVDIVGAGESAIQREIVGATSAVQRGAYSIDNLVAGFPSSASILDTAVDNSTLVPVRPIRATKLFLDAAFTVAGAQVDQLRVGAVNQNIGNGPLPGSMFTGDSVAPPLKGDTIQPNVGAVLTLINQTGGPVVNISKAILGPAAVGA